MPLPLPHSRAWPEAWKPKSWSMIVRTSQRGAAGHGVKKTPVFTKTNCERKTWILLGNYWEILWSWNLKHMLNNTILPANTWNNMWLIGICKESYVEGADALLVEYGGLDVPFLQSNLWTCVQNQCRIDQHNPFPLTINTHLKPWFCIGLAFCRIIPIGG